MRKSAEPDVEVVGGMYSIILISNMRSYSLNRSIFSVYQISVAKDLINDMFDEVFYLG